MKKWLVLFLVGLYSFVPLTSLHPNLGWISITLTLVSGCFHVANAVKMQCNTDSLTGISMKSIMIFKLCLLPVYAVFLFMLLMSVGMMLSVWFTFAGLVIAPIVIIFSYFVLLTSSALTISKIILLGRKRRLSILQCIVHIILQLFFVTDVVGSMIVCGKEAAKKG